MCDSCRLDDNYFATVQCVYDYLKRDHHPLWLRDSSRIGPGYISRNFLNHTGHVLAIWNGPGRGWRLRTYPQEALDDERPHNLHLDYAALNSEADCSGVFENME